MPSSAVASPFDKDDEDACPVCYEPYPTTCDGRPTPVPCKVCPYAICGECDKRLRLSGHEQCPMCRAPRPRQLPALHVVIHAFHCRDAACERARCPEAKVVLQWLAAHSQTCAAGPDGCKVCSLWRVLNNSRTPSAVFLTPVLQDTENVHPESAATRMRPGTDAVRARLLELPTAQLKRMLLVHVLQCSNRQCRTCRCMHERMRVRMGMSKRAWRLQMRVWSAAASVR